MLCAGPLNDMVIPDGEGARVLAAVADASADPIVLTDPDGLLVAWNRAAGELCAEEGRDLAGQPLSALLALEPARLAAVLDDLRAGRRFGGLETAARTSRGRSIKVSLSGSPVRGPAGEFTGAVFVARDVSGQADDARALQASEDRRRSSEARWRAVVDSAVDAIVVIDARGAIEAFNPAAERLFGYTEHEVRGQNVSMLMPPPFSHEHDGYLSRYLREGGPRVIGVGREVRGRRRDGTVFPLHLSVGEMSLGGERKFTGILHDLTARVRIEEQLREQEALARLGEMAAVLAHEVKNPLAGIRGAVQIIGGRLPPASKDAQIVGEIVSRVDALGRLMRDLLLFARPPTPNPSPVELLPLVASTADLLRSDAALGDVRIDVEGSAPPVAADAGLLKIVFINLLVNSADAMNGRGTIRVSARASETACTVAFNDSGPGIPADVREKIFTPFFTTKARGTGLGLPTARRLIEAHRGTISVECPPQGGTIFTIELPIHA